jgi:alpha-tubulin suppressor-like RCC1 family protein
VDPALNFSIGSWRKKDSHTCALTTSGGVRCWGMNAVGQLGDGTTIGCSTPPSKDALTGVQAVALGAAHTCALMMSGGVRCWGNNRFGQFGNGTVGPPNYNPTPPSLDVLTGVQAIAGGGSHSCALTLLGSVVCWGYNGFGEVGDGTIENGRPTPTMTGPICP